MLFVALKGVDNYQWPGTTPGISVEMQAYNPELRSFRHSVYRQPCLSNLFNLYLVGDFAKMLDPDKCEVKFNILGLQCLDLPWYA